MPIDIDPETINIDPLPGIWTPVQWDLNEEEQIMELDNQATASILFAVDVPEAVLRLFLNEYEIERAFDPPDGYDPDEQGEWDHDLLTFQFKRPIKLIKVERERDGLYVEYDFYDLGRWVFEIQSDRVQMRRV
jgi:hypothetical protein